MRSECFSMKPTLAGSHFLLGNCLMTGENLAKVTQASGYACVFVYWAQRFISQMNPFFFFYCDGSNHEYPLGNKLCEGSLAKQVINIGHRPHFNILVWNRAAKKPRKHFQKRSIVLAISWNPEQQASCALLLPSSWAWAEDTSSVTLLNVQPPKWAKICKYYFFIGWERRQREHQDPPSISNAMSLRASQFSENRPIQMEQGMREGKLESRLPDMNWSLMYEGAGLPNCYVSFQIYKSGHLLSTEF